MRYISLPSILNAIIGITSCYYCVILKIVILHDGIKTIQNGVFLFSLKKKKMFFFFKSKKRYFSKKKTKKQVSFFLNKSFLNPGSCTLGGPKIRFSRVRVCMFLDVFFFQSNLDLRKVASVII